MLVPTIAAATRKLVPPTVLATTALRFATTGAYELTGQSWWMHVAGLVGLCLCALAVYAALAMALEDASGNTRLPLGRGGTGRDSLGGGLDSQLAIEQEPGVREQL